MENIKEQRRRPLNNIITLKLTTQFLDLLDKQEYVYLTTIEKLENQHLTYGKQIKRIIAKILDESK